MRGRYFESNELEIRLRLLRTVLITTIVSAACWLAVTLSGMVQTRSSPWDVLVVLTISALALVFMRWQRLPIQWRYGITASLFITLASQPLFYTSQFLGIRSPANALLGVIVLIGIVLFGAWFTLQWTGMMCGWVLLQAAGEVNGWWGPTNAIRSWADIAPWLFFWWVVLIATGWLAWLFSSNLERVLAVSRGQTTALAATLSTLTTEADPATALDQVFKATADQLGARWATLLLIEDGVLHTRRAYANGTVLSGAALDHVALPPFLAAQSALWQDIARTRRPIVVDDISNDPRILHRARLLADGIQTILIVPLVLNDDVIGSLHFNSTARRRYRTEELEVALALAQQVTLALQLQRLAEQTEHQAITNERNRMAREMHDTLAQGFAGIVVQLEAADDAIADDADAARAHVDRARTLARTSLTEARRAVWALRPHLLEARDLLSALRAATLAITDGTAINVDVDLPAAVPPLRSEMETALLRIAQEAVTNAVKHADATTLHVALARQNGHVELAVTDDGHGFDPAAAKPSADGGFGLIGMHERAARIGGRVDVCSAPGHGTTITAKVPAA